MVDPFMIFIKCCVNTITQDPMIIIIHMTQGFQLHRGRVHGAGQITLHVIQFSAPAGQNSLYHAS